MNKSVFRVLPVVGGLLLMTACTATPAALAPTTTTSEPPMRPVTVTTTTTTTEPAAQPTHTATSSQAPAPSCPVSPVTAPLPQVPGVSPVPAADRVQVRIGGLAANSTLVSGGRLVEFTVTFCNDSPVNYPSIAPAVVSDHCTCSHTPVEMPTGTLERFDPASGTWHQIPGFSMGTGMDYLMTQEPASPLPKGREITYRYRIAYGAGLAAGEGGINATAVGLPQYFQAGSADLPLAVAAP